MHKIITELKKYHEQTKTKNMESLGFISIFIALLCIYKSVYRFIDKELIKQAKLFSVLGLGFAIFYLLGETDMEIMEQIIWTVVATLFIWFISHSMLNKDVTKKFKSEEKDKNSAEYFFTPTVYRKTNQFTNKDIPFYVRFTLYEITVSDRKMIFDSSDYSLINEKFGTFAGIQQAFQIGHNFKLNEITYNVESVQVDMMELFDDYSNGHTKAYVGEDIPYNIQVFAELKKIK